MRTPRFLKGKGLRWFLAAVAVFVLFTAIRAQRSTPAPALTVRAQDALETVLASGRVIGEKTVPLSFVRPGRIAEEFIRDGDAVSAGQVLMRLDARHEDRALEQARMALAEAKLRREKLRTADVPEAEEKVKQARIQDIYAADFLERQTGLFQQKAVTQVQFEQARRDRELTASALASAENRLNALHGVETAQADLAVARAENVMKQAEIDLQDTILKAPVSGRIVSHDARPGEYISAGQKVVTFIPKASRSFVDIQVDETQAGRLVPGQRAAVSSTAFPGRVFTGEVERTGAVVDAQRGSFTVRLVLDNLEPGLLPESSVNVQVEIGRVSGILLLEQRFIIRDNGRAAVFIAEGRRARRIPVVTRDLGGGLVECIEGLREGQTVLLPQGLKDGLKVKPVPLPE
ncbi:MAG: efflux RND transporter periplasmic adaptor subunit [Candidatus Aminicenantes bacterium]|nr:efflux RND transporter periplasmic adaptor subunit [Candidatus Aminicenantes bacterium]